MLTVTPVTYPDIGEQSHTAAPATSSTSPSRPSGISQFQSDR